MARPKAVFTVEYKLDTHNLVTLATWWILYNSPFGSFILKERVPEISPEKLRGEMEILLHQYGYAKTIDLLPRTVTDMERREMMAWITENLPAAFPELDWTYLTEQKEQ